MPAQVIGQYPAIWTRSDALWFDHDIRISTVGMGMQRGDLLLGILSADATDTATQLRATPGSVQPFNPVIKDVRYGTNGMIAALMVAEYTGFETYFNFELTAGPAGLSCIHVRGVPFVTNTSGFRMVEGGTSNTLGPLTMPLGVTAGSVVNVGAARTGEAGWGLPTGGLGFDVVLSKPLQVTSGQIAFKTLNGETSVPATTLNHTSVPYLWHAMVVFPFPPPPITAGFGWIVD